MLVKGDGYRSKAELLKIKNFKLAEFSHVEEDSQGNKIPFFLSQRNLS